MSSKARSIHKTWSTSFQRKSYTVIIMRVARKFECQLTRSQRILLKLKNLVNAGKYLQHGMTKHCWTNRLNRAQQDPLTMPSALCQELLYHQCLNNQNQLARLKSNQASLQQTWIASILKVWYRHIALRISFRMPALIISHSTVPKSNSRMLANKSLIPSDWALLREHPVNIVLHTTRLWMVWRHQVGHQSNNSTLFSKGRLRLMRQLTRRSSITWLRLNNQRSKKPTPSF